MSILLFKENMMCGNKILIEILNLKEDLKL